jgi:DNA-binding CsgD family transcriptional regulator
MIDKNLTPDDIRKKRRSITTVLIIFLVVFLLGVDLLHDYMGWFGLSFFIIEAFSLVLLSGLLIYLFLQLIHSKKETGVLKDEIKEVKRDAKKWKENAKKWKEEASHLLNGLGEAIDRQFTTWKLTPAESEIGLLMLKGLSFKEISEIRTTGERTVRQQAQSIYKKTGLAGRTEFAAFFLEDLLLPVRNELLPDSKNSNK